MFSHVMVGADDVEASKRKGVLAVVAPPYINEQARRGLCQSNAPICSDRARHRIGSMLVPARAAESCVLFVNLVQAAARNTDHASLK